MSERTKDRTKERTNERTDEWANEQTNERTNERTNEWMNEWMNDWVNVIINPYALIPVSPAASTSIQGYDNLCVTSQGGSPCSTTNGAHLVYSMQTSCRNTSAKFTFLNGVLKQHCSGKRICPKGVYYGAPLVISDSCEESQAKFERTKGTFTHCTYTPCA